MTNLPSTSTFRGPFHKSAKQPDPYSRVGVPLQRVQGRGESPSPSAWTFSSNSSAQPKRPQSPPARKNSREQDDERPSKAMDLAMRGVSTMLLIPMPFLESVRNRARGKGKRRANVDTGAEEHESDDEEEEEVDVIVGSDNGYLAYADEPNTLKCLAGLRSPSPLPGPPNTVVKKTHRKHNSLVLPDVDVPRYSRSPSPLPASITRPQSALAATVDTPPPSASRAVQFTIDAPPRVKRRTDLFEAPVGRGEDEEPAWSDFMVSHSRSRLSSSHPV
ncbi:hypothetical protein MIND_01241600 [Mycena indigotica]|uniref:Uncharacterized protein n=1 Tax=Mycena indigotica TaxID=2126181 RepID=A0A8H6S3M1_9AGAR|nr:uncharacterized protein MIND_01241600 [Mycena indigotica]KAF7292146.1 hypothetical protein MIND_01241600 [Mycena indigotica]